MKSGSSTIFSFLPFSSFLLWYLASGVVQTTQAKLQAQFPLQTHQAGFSERILFQYSIEKGGTP